MRALTARWGAGCAAAGSVRPAAGAVVLAYVDRHLVPAGLAGWNLFDVSGGSGEPLGGTGIAHPATKIFAAAPSAPPPGGPRPAGPGVGD